MGVLSVDDPSFAGVREWEGGGWVWGEGWALLYSISVKKRSKVCLLLFRQAVKNHGL